MTATSKTVCLRAFNEDLGGTNPWDRQGPSPPPLPKRIAWPGGKIVSNKDEALASFLRRKLDQGQKLTPEQMAMLEKMVDPNASSTPAAPVATAGGKRKIRSTGDGFGRVGASRADARGLLHKLERKVAKAPGPFEPTNDNRGGGGRVEGHAASSKWGSRTNLLDLSSLKRGGTKARAGNTNNSGGGRRILPDGQGGFKIATTTPPGTDEEDFDDCVMGTTTIIVPRETQQTSSKRPRGARSLATARAWGAADEPSVSAAVAATIPAVYLKAGLSNNTAKKNKGGKAGVQGGAKGKRAAGQQRQKGRGQGINVTKAIPKGAAGGGVVVSRSLEDLMSGGLAACRR